MLDTTTLNLDSSSSSLPRRFRRSGRPNNAAEITATSASGSTQIIISVAPPSGVAIYVAELFGASLVRAEKPLSEAYQTMLASEAVLSRDWDRPEEDEAWANL